MVPNASESITHLDQDRNGLQLLPGLSLGVPCWSTAGEVE